MSEEMIRLLTLRLDLARRIQAAYKAGRFALVRELRAEATAAHRAVCVLEIHEVSRTGRRPECATSRFDNNDGAPPRRRHR